MPIKHEALDFESQKIDKRCFLGTGQEYTFCSLCGSKSNKGYHNVWCCSIEGTLLFWLLKCAWFERPQPQDLSQTDISKRLHFFFHFLCMGSIEWCYNVEKALCDMPCHHGTASGQKDLRMNPLFVQRYPKLARVSSSPPHHHHAKQAVNQPLYKQTMTNSDHAISTKVASYHL
jgi:hypothetical protein